MISHRSARRKSALQNAAVPRDAVVSLSLEEALRPALESMLVGLRRHRETPLLAGFDSQGLALAAMNSCSIGLPPIQLDQAQLDQAQLDQAQLEWSKVVRSLSALVQQSLMQETLLPSPRVAGPQQESPQGEGAPAECSDPPRKLRQPSRLHPMAIWLEQFYETVRKAHPKGIELVALRLAGLSSRDTATRLGLPFRLCERVTHDVAQAWSAAREAP